MQKSQHQVHITHIQAFKTYTQGYLHLLLGAESFLEVNPYNPRYPNVAGQVGSGSTTLSLIYFKLSEHQRRKLLSIEESDELQRNVQRTQLEVHLGDI